MVEDVDRKRDQTPAEEEVPSVVVDLPQAPAPEVPEDERAVAIDDVAVDPTVLVGGTGSTMSIPLGSVADPSSRREDRYDLSTVGEAPALVAERLGQRRREVMRERGFEPEASAMLTADRLLETTRRSRRAPEGGWNRALYTASMHLVNLGDSAKVRERKALDERIRRDLGEVTRFVPVLTRKGGVGKTTVTALLGMALADVRDDRVIAIDANPDRGTLAERISEEPRATVRDIVDHAHDIHGYTDFSHFVSRDVTRLDMLASDTDPQLSEAFSEGDYDIVADLAARYYSLVLTDCGTGIVHSVMRATLRRADAIVVVSGGSVDEARLASETLTWLEANGYGDLVENAIVALNTATQGTNLVKVEELEAHFRSRVRDIVRIPYDPQLAAGAAVSYKDLKPLTQLAARSLAALVVEGLPGESAA